MTESEQDNIAQVTSAVESKSRYLQACKSLRSVVRVLTGTLAVCAIGAVGVLAYLLASESFPPRTEIVLGTERWKPFLESSTHYSDSLQHMDDGSLALILHPEISDWNAYLNSVTDEALHVGWVRAADMEGRWVGRPYHIRRHAGKLLRKYSDTGGAVHAYFTRQVGPDEPDWLADEVVELTHLEKSGEVMFVSFYR